MIKENGLYIDTYVVKDVYCKLKQLEDELGGLRRIRQNESIFNN